MREEEGLSMWDEVINPRHRAYEYQNIRVKLPNTMKIFLPIPQPCFFRRETVRGGGICRVSWIVFDQTGPLQGSLLTFSNKETEALADHHIITRSLIAIPQL